MVKPNTNYAFIDSQNVNIGTREQGWTLDWSAFRDYLQMQHNVSKAFLFIGFVEENTELYTSLQSAGFIVVFKPTSKTREGVVKGNVDAELVLQAMIEYPHYDKAVVVSGDGDFASLVRHLRKNNKLECVIVPDEHRFSAILERAATPQIEALSALRARLTKKGHAHDEPVIDVEPIVEAPIVIVKTPLTPTAQIKPTGRMPGQTARRRTRRGGRGRGGRGGKQRREHKIDL